MIRALSQGRERRCRLARCLSDWCSAAVLAMGVLAMGVLAMGVLAMPAAAAEYALAPGQKVVGEIAEYVIRPGEGLNEIARKFDVGYTALAAANAGLDQFSPGTGRRLLIPSLYVLPDAPHQGIVINLAQYRLFYFPPGGDRVETYPLGLAVFGSKTPLGATSVVRKEPHPTWYPPASIRAERPELPAMIPPGPDNPLGDYALHLGWPRYLIHGTNKPDGTGRNVSHGCIRMYPEDIERLFNEVSVGTPVRTVSQPVGAAWSEDGGLYVRVYPSKSQVEEIDIDRPVTPEPLAGVESLVRAEAEGYAGAIDWVAVRQAAQERTGMPILVADKSGLARLQQRRQIEARRAYDTSPAQRYAREAVQAYDRQATQAYGREPARPAYGPEPTPAYSYAPYYGDQSVRSYLPYHGPEPAQPYERYYRRESVQPF